VLYCYELQRNALPRVRLVCLVRSCYVFLLSCYRGGIVIVQPFLQKMFSVMLMKRPPPQTAFWLASKTFKKLSYACVGVSDPCVFHT
jgi:hypothetical protein